jgi:hypothetical protein
MNHEHEQDQKLTILIESTQGDWEATFHKTAKISEVIETTRQHFGFSHEGNYQLKLATGETMRPERTLVSYQLKDGDRLTFVDLGVAVSYGG